MSAFDLFRLRIKVRQQTREWMVRHRAQLTDLFWSEAELREGWGR
jgi:hypothetical protein